MLTSWCTVIFFKSNSTLFLRKRCWCSHSFLCFLTICVEPSWCAFLYSVLNQFLIFELTHIFQRVLLSSIVINVLFRLNWIRITNPTTVEQRFWGTGRFIIHNHILHYHFIFLSDKSCCWRVMLLEVAVCHFMHNFVEILLTRFLPLFFEFFSDFLKFSLDYFTNYIRFMTC